MLLAEFLSSLCPSCWGRRGEAHLPGTWDAQPPLSPQAHRAPLGTRTWVIRVEGRGLGRFFSLSTGLDPQPIQRILMCRSPLKCCRWGTSTGRFGPPGITTKNVSSLNHDELGQGPRQLTQAWMSPENFHYRERIVAWINRTRYKSLAKWNKTSFPTFS